MSDVLERKLARANKKIAALEGMVENKTRDLFEANRGLETANTFMTQVLRSMAGALIVTDANREVQLVNKRFSSFLGYSEEEVVGHDVRRVLPEAGGFRGGKGHQLIENETYCVTKAGGEIPVALTTGRIQSDEEDGETQGLIYIAIDIRERKAAQSKLRDAQRRLVDASKQAGMAEIATGILHNVGNVLNSVNVSGSIVRETIRKSKAPSVRRLSDLILTNRSSLGEFFTEDAKGMKVPDFLDSLATHLDPKQAHNQWTNGRFTAVKLEA